MKTEYFYLSQNDDGFHYLFRDPDNTRKAAQLGIDPEHIKSRILALLKNSDASAVSFSALANTPPWAQFDYDFDLLTTITAEIEREGSQLMFYLDI